MDYKELIDELRDKKFERDEELFCTPFECGAFVLCDKAANAIETLLEERNAAIEDLRGMCWCCSHGKKWDKAPEWSKMTTCEHIRESGALARGGGKCKCKYWVWRGIKEKKYDMG